VPLALASGVVRTLTPSYLIQSLVAEALPISGTTPLVLIRLYLIVLLVVEVQLQSLVYQLV
jgi:hypothetical protein